MYSFLKTVLFLDFFVCANANDNDVSVISDVQRKLDALELRLEMEIKKTTALEEKLEVKTNELRWQTNYLKEQLHRESLKTQILSEKLEDFLGLGQNRQDYRTSICLYYIQKLYVRGTTNRLANINF